MFELGPDRVVNQRAGLRRPVTPVLGKPRGTIRALVDANSPMSDLSDRIVSKLWSYCQVLRDDGLSYQDYLEQLTFLLFLKMADERAALTGVDQTIPKGCRWADLANPKMEGIKLEQHYRDTLKKLGEQGGMLGLIFRKSQNKIQDPAKLRLCAMNLFLNGIGPDDDTRKPPILGGEDSLRNEPSSTVDVVLTNPPFGKKSSITVVNDEGETDRESITYNRPDFWTTTSNKQLNFVQHVKSLLKIHGRAAVVVPDNVLFEGGAGERVRRKLLQECEVHTLLRLPTGIFYAQGVKANVIFFNRKPGAKDPWTKQSGSTTCARTRTSRSRPVG